MRKVNGFMRPKRPGASCVWGLLACLAFINAGCERMVTTVMINAPNHGKHIDQSPGLTQGPKFWGVDHQLHVAVGPPQAVLRAWVFEPVEVGGMKPKPRGTVLVVHGWRNDMLGILSIGKSFAKAGYRSVMVDLRGHGQSSGQYITYGVQESRDLSQLIDALQTHNLLQKPLGVWGISMGATTSIKLAAQDDRIKAVVAVAPYTSLRDVAPNLMRVLLPGYTHSLTETQRQAMITEAGALANFNPDHAEALNAITSFTAPVLLMHGNWDLIVPYKHGQTLYNAGADHTQFVSLNGLGHTQPHFDFGGGIRRQSVEWFDRFMVDGETIEP